MAEQTVVTVIVMVIGFVGQAAYLKGAFGAQIKDNERRIEVLEKHKERTCEPLFRDLGNSVARIEGRRGGDNR